jgi:flavodoxin
MKASLLVESLTGNTWKAAEQIAAHLEHEKWNILGLSSLRHPDHSVLQASDVVLIGTWVHGAFVFAQAPWGDAAIRSLPSLSGKKVANFCTFALNPGRTLDIMAASAATLGADVVGGLALHRSKLALHTEVFAERLTDALSVTS